MGERGAYKQRRIVSGERLRPSLDGRQRADERHKPIEQDENDWT
jgi:hypothetical protein